MHIRSHFCAALALMGLMISSTATLAHEFILKPDTATPAAGQKTRMQAQAAHVFMVSEEAENPANVRLYLLQGDKKTDIALVEDKALVSLVGDFTLAQNGPAMLVGHRLPQIWCETTQGEMEGSRAALEAKGMKVKSSGKYEKFAKTLLNPASNDTLFGKALGQDLELVLLTNPADIKPGAPLNVQVLLRGKPVPNAAGQHQNIRTLVEQIFRCGAASLRIGE